MCHAETDFYKFALVLWRSGQTLHLLRCCYIKEMRNIYLWLARIELFINLSMVTQ